MNKILLVAQTLVVACLLGWISFGSGCGAKSQLLVDDEEETETEREPAIVGMDCDSDDDCDDGVFCNGDELCVSGSCELTEPVDCGEGDDCHMRYCDEDRDSCIELLIAEDVDGDGFFGRPCGDDCDDTDASIYPGARERCNGLDDDCDGAVDEDLVEECEVGSRRCVEGEWTECIECEVCQPGSVRYCDEVFYCSWGSQRCNSDGTGWLDCVETSPPPACSDEGYYYDLECCQAAGYCCQDYFDSDNDGDFDESIGACDDVNCPGS